MARASGEWRLEGLAARPATRQPLPKWVYILALQYVILFKPKLNIGHTPVLRVFPIVRNGLR
jgi:hypothetical protein